MKCAPFFSETHPRLREWPTQRKLTVNEPQPGGPVRDYLQRCGFLTEEEKRGFSGTYGFLSGGPHPGIVDQEAARLGRNFALGSCQYALQKYERWVANGYRGF